MSRRSVVQVGMQKSTFGRTLHASAPCICTLRHSQAPLDSLAKNRPPNTTVLKGQAKEMTTDHIIRLACSLGCSLASSWHLNTCRQYRIDTGRDSTVEKLGGAADRGLYRERLFPHLKGAEVIPMKSYSRRGNQIVGETNREVEIEKITYLSHAKTLPQQENL
jgi:hypothetical protein